MYYFIYFLLALAEAASPYGIESFDPVLIEIWHRVQDTRGKGLAALLKAIGFIVPLMDPDNAGNSWLINCTDFL